ncbi:ANKRD42 [Acanthosepion pharaonis]|uniref:ANKRD42 n=1 Tax=Acanthosepion pharaonis TaxID=158019 RepID=A0A812ATT4_ACAPH|nr:ANKRD42 [Sepia pharaonis]
MHKKNGFSNIKTMQKYANIHEAVKCEDIKEVEEMVKCGANINEISIKNKFTPLHSACNAGALECVHWLLWQGADPTMCTPQGWTPVHIAAIRGHDFCLQALVNNNVSLNTRDNRGSTALHMAAAHGNSFCLNTLMRGGADVNAVDKNGWTAMHAAAFHGRLGCVQTLFKWQGRIDDTDNYGNTPAHLAAMEGHLLCIKFLLSCKSNPRDIFGARNDHGEIPKDLAEQFYKDDVVKYIETIEKEKDGPENMENLSFPAHVAASKGDVEYLRKLIENGVININERDDKGCTPAHKAAGQGHSNILKWLIEMGADLSIKNDLGDMAKDLAERFAHLSCVKLLTSACPVNEEELGIEEIRQSPVVEGAYLQKQAKSRAKQKMINLEHDLEIAKKNYIQLGGVLIDEKKKLEQLREKDQHIDELDAQLEYERLRREKLEAQLDQYQQEMAYLSSKLAQHSAAAMESSEWVSAPSKQSSAHMRTLKKGHSTEGTFIKRSFVAAKKKPLKASTA